MYRKILALITILVLLTTAIEADATCTAGNPNANVPEDTPSSAFTNNGDGTVTHNLTGLMWKQCVEGQSGASCATGTATTFTWTNALLQAKIANFAGQTDWRLPNLNELESIVEKCGYSPSINLTIFPATPTSLFWSSSSYVPDPTNAWPVDFSNGSTGFYYKANGGYVRLVRSGQSFGSFDVKNVVGGAQVPLNLITGWNLLGNSSSTAFDIATTFGDPAKIITVWKWNNTASKWAFYTPAMTSTALATYAQSKSYDVLSSVASKEGFWVNASTAATLNGPIGSGVTLTASDLQPNWNLVGSADNLTPSQLNSGLNSSLTAAGKSMVTAWAWDASNKNWKFYSPALEAQGGTVLADYITQKSYLPFGAALSAADGYWLNIGSAAASGSGGVPTVTGMSTNSGATGTTVIISGTNFSITPANNTVMFNGVAATVAAATATSLTVTVPSGATSGTVSVTTSSGSATSSGSFSVTGGGEPPVTTGSIATSTLTFLSPVNSVIFQNPLTMVSSSTVNLYAFSFSLATYGMLPSTVPATPWFQLELTQGLQSAGGSLNVASNSYWVNAITGGSHEVSASVMNPILTVNFHEQGTGGTGGGSPGTISQSSYCVIAGGVSPSSNSCSSLGITLDYTAGTITFLNTPLIKWDTVQGKYVQSNSVTGTLRAGASFNQGTSSSGSSTSPISATAVTTAQSLTFGTAITSFSPLTASGGAIPYIYSITTGTLPTGLSLDASTGTVSGIPTATYATANVTFSVKDANNVMASTTSTVSVTVAMPTGYVYQGGLLWMPDSAATYAQAVTLCSGTILGLTGWRLPTMVELNALYISGLIAGNWWPLGFTWTSELSSGSTIYWTVYMSSDGRYVGGGGYGGNKINSLYATCVR